MEDYAIKKIELTQTTPKAAVMVAFTYDPYGRNGGAADQIIADKNIETGSLGVHSRKFTVACGTALLLMGEFLECGALSAELFRERVVDITSNRNISLGGMLRVARDHEDRSADLGDK